MGLHFKWRCMCVSNCFPPKMHLSSVIRQTIQQLGEGCFSKEEEATQELMSHKLGAEGSSQPTVTHQLGDQTCSIHRQRQL